MVRPSNTAIGTKTLRFGAGLNTRSSALRIGELEVAEGENFDLDLDRTFLCGRKPFVLRGTAPNNLPINGFAQLKKIDGSISTLVQAGGEVYEWDGASSFISRGTVNAAARLRGYDWQNWALDERVLITDIAGQQVLMEWDGTTLQQVVTTGITGDFYARYCVVDDDRAIYANLKAGTTIPHVVAISKLEDYKTLSTTRPSSSANESDPAYLTAPNLRPINGLVAAFSTLALSTVGRNMYRLDGRSAKDFAFDKLYPDSGASGSEAVAYIGNDIAFGRNSQIETLFTSFQFGDVKTDDLSRPVANLIRPTTQWNIQFDRRRGKVYCLDALGSRIFVLHKPIIDENIREVVQNRIPSGLSPWSLWTTQHPMAFQTNVLMPMIDPQTGLEEIFMGGPTGEVFRFEGEGYQDGGAYPVRMRRRSKIYQSDPPGGLIRKISGHLLYNQIGEDTSVDLTFLFGGEIRKDDTSTVVLPGVSSSGSYFNDDAYFNGNAYFGTEFEGRTALKKFSATGHGNTVQVEIAFSSENCSLEELHVDFYGDAGPQG